MLQIAHQKGEPLDGHALYTIRTGVAWRGTGSKGQRALPTEDDCHGVSMEEAVSKEIIEPIDC